MSSYNTTRSKRRFTVWSTITLLFTMLVINWGAYVRITGSGAGCGRHWPLCDGEIIPREPAAEMAIEFSHRLTSGLSLLLVFGLTFFAFKLWPTRHPIRFWAIWSLAFMLFEALVGAGLVMFELVGKNDSMARAYVMALHLINTFALLAGITAMCWHSIKERVVRSGSGYPGGFFWVCVSAVVVVGATGAVTALGDTLFPAETLAAGIRGDFAADSHFLVRLRIIHPLIAIGSSVFLWIFSVTLYNEFKLQRLSFLLAAILISQLICGVVNVLLLAPVTLQMVHLFLADCLWVTLMISGFEVALRREEQNLFSAARSIEINA